MVQDDDFRQQPHPLDDYDVHRQIQEEEQLPEDYEPPLSQPNDRDTQFTSQHSLLDDRSDMADQEIYDEGEDDAAVDSLGANLSPDGNAILGYDPDKDERRKKL